MYEHPNMLSSELSQDKNFTQEIAQALEKFFDSSDVSFVKTKLLDSKIITDKKDVYLVVKKNGAHSVYHDIMFSDKPFLYLKESLKKNSEIYAPVLYASKPKAGQMLTTKFKSLLDKINDSDKSLKASPEDLAKIFGVALGDGFKTTSSPYDLKMFFQFLNKKGFLDTKIEDSFLETKSSAVAKAIDYQEDLLISTDFLIDMANKHKLSVKKKFEFNDLDNHMWKQYDGLVVTDQNCAFYIVKNDNTYTYYAWDKERTGGKKNQSLSSLVKDISQNPESLIDNVALKIVDNNIVFVDNAFIYSLGFDIHHTKLAFMNEHKETLEYPVDIRSYDYQLAYRESHRPKERCFGIR